MSSLAGSKQVGSFPEVNDLLHYVSTSLLKRFLVFLMYHCTKVNVSRTKCLTDCPHLTTGAILQSAIYPITPQEVWNRYLVFGLPDAVIRLISTQRVRGLIGDRVVLTTLACSSDDSVDVNLAASGTVDG